MSIRQVPVSLPLSAADLRYLELDGSNASADVDIGDHDFINNFAPYSFAPLNADGYLVGIIIPRYDTADNLASVVMEAGEFATTSDTHRILQGDGATAGGTDVIEYFNSNNNIDFGKNVLLTGTQGDEVITDGGFTPAVVSAWATATAYSVDGKVKVESVYTGYYGVYVCLEAHTSGTFTDDLAAGKWQAQWLYNNDGTGWAKVTLKISKNADGTATLSQPVDAMVEQIVAGEWYTLEYDIASWSVGSVTPSAGGVTFFTRSASGNDISQTFQAVSADGLSFLPTDTSRFQIDNISLKKQYGVIRGSSLLLDGSTGGTIASGGGSRLMWIPSKRAFRAGYVYSTQWDDPNIGLYSAAFGSSCTASGQYSFASGTTTYATGTGAIAFGGDSTTASGTYAFASGASATASSTSSFASGYSVTSAGSGSFAAGYSQNVPGSLVAGYSGGYGQIAVGYASSGKTLTAYGTGSIAMGQDVNATTNPNVLVFGRGLTISTQDSFNVGFGTGITTPDFQVTSGLATVNGALTVTGLGTFGDLDVDTLNFNGNVISDSTGAISFDDENLTTTGTVTVGGAANTEQLIIKANASQTTANPLLQFQDSAGTPIFSITSDGTQNFFMGAGAGDENVNTGTTGVFNIFMGTNAGTKNTSGNYNIAIGGSSYTKATTAENNTALGYAALLENTSGHHNLALGGGALRNSTEGSYNIAIGSTAGYSNSTGGYNVAIGGAALANTGAYSYNVGIGYQAGLNTAQYYNTFIGYKAGYTNSTGARSVFIGNYAGYYETVGYKLFIDSLDRTNEATARTNSLIYGVFNATVADQSLTINAGTLNFNAGTDADLAINFTGTSNSGLINWMEDEDYFKFSDDVLMNSNERIYFRDGSQSIASLASATLDITGATIVLNGYVEGDNASFTQGNDYAILGNSGLHFGVAGSTEEGVGVRGDSTGAGLAGYFGGDVEITGSLTYSTSDPIVETFYPTTRNNAIQLAYKNTPSDKFGGVSLYFNSDAKKLEVYDQTTGKVYEFVMTEVEQRTAWQPDNSEIARYIFDTETGEAKLVKRLVRTKHKLVSGVYVDPKTGKFVNKMNQEVAKSEAVIGP